MAIRYYDDILVKKLQRWIPSAANVRVLGPDEVQRLFETQADDSGDKPLQLPLFALSRESSITLLSTTKRPMSYDGLRLKDLSTEEKMPLFNVIPVKVNYQLDIYAKTMEEADEYIRNILFKLINNPTVIIEIPYNSTYLQHIANIRVNDIITDSSNSARRIFPGQFYRWTVQFELQDAFLFSVPYKDTWKFILDDTLDDTLEEEQGEWLPSKLEVVTMNNETGEEHHIDVEPLNLELTKD